MEKRKKRWLIIGGAILLILLILAGLFLGQFISRKREFDARPLVLIHSPRTFDDFKVGDGVLVHATAREDHGLRRMELWVNDRLVDARDAEKPWPTNMTLASSWVPTYQGNQVIVVKAISASGIDGKSTIQIAAREAEPLSHLVEEGDTLESVASEYITTPEELSALNPDLGGGAPSPGDRLLIPDGEGIPGGILPEDESGDPPPVEGDPPSQDWTIPFFRAFALRDDEQVTLRLEIPGLRTWESFDGLHCYVSLADSLPQWYPDLDHNQATDEYFTALNNGWWDTESILVGDSAPLISWPGDQPLPLSVACVGERGGTEAIELGLIEMQILPEEWDGIRHSHESDGEGGHVELDVRVSQLSGDPRNAPKYPDPAMPRPYNLSLNQEEGLLEWEFNPDDDYPVDGFRIYLNGNLQWVEDEDARSTSLPPEWFRPPCAWTYTFGVTSYQIDFPDGPESDPPSEIDLEQPREECMRRMRVTFLELETFDLGGDGRYERRHGDVGPAYGTFYANEAQVSFDHGHEGPGLDMVEGLSHNTTYDLAVVSGDLGWHFDGPNSVVAEVPFGGELQLGYTIMDRDNNPDDLVCQGIGYPILDAYGALDGYHRETLTSDNERCRVTYEYEPTEDSPVGERYEGGEPLPWLDVALLDVYSDPDQTIVVVENSGTASWPGRTLNIELLTRDGSSLGQVIFDDVEIGTGDTETFRIPRTTLEPLIDVCVLLDPNDTVLELYERSGALIHNPVCTKLPDLVISDTAYSDSDQTLRVSVQNQGDGPVSHWPLGIDVALGEGAMLVDGFQIPDLVLAAGRSFVVEIPLAGDTDRSRMFNGYTVTLNPEQLFPESEYENNSRVIPEGTEIQLGWYAIEVPEGLRNIVEFHIDAYILQGTERKAQIADWNQTQDINWTSCSGGETCFVLFDGYSAEDYVTPHLEIFGDEDLELQLQINHPGSLWRNFSITEIYNPPGWEAGDNGPRGGCDFLPTRDDIGRHSFWFSDGASAEWYTRIDICRDNYEE